MSGELLSRIWGGSAGSAAGAAKGGA
jgi:hypothetical protein